MKVHLSGVCGTAMASLAGLLRERGHDVTGSDQDVYPPMSTQLQAMGIPLRSPYAAENVPADADVVVIGNALSRGNPEIETVLDRGQRMTSLPALLAEDFLRDRTSVVVAGTHGKTTTSAWLAFLLDRAGLDPSFVVGGVPVDFGRSYRLGAGRAFVVEGDEYDSAFFDKRPKFVHYLPEIAVIGNVEFDHADIYADLEAVKTAFFRLMTVIPRRGLLVAGIESAALRELLPRAFCRVETFALEQDADWRATGLRPGHDGWRFRIVRRGTDLGEFRIALPGEHNVRNALAAIAAAAGLGVEPARLGDALASFRGVRRRLELRGEARGVRVYDDFAHHPTAVRETLRALRALEAGRLVAVFEPRSYTSRTRVFQEDFARAFSEADEVLVAAAFLPGKVPEAQRISERELVAAIEGRGRRARFVPTVEAIVGLLTEELRAGDRVAVLSNGGFGGIHERLLAALRE
ncbi:MAG TPA: UDP-N-acetylmuramate:L-alanyl-gamma-D-glutamyl-meso-diaminopimelate ligase [Vicinamibacteria bacterium]|nr:UDP-N-acetylmuramate:L-alanyl-gamma-D-glutamyl-meso-diaminopimelate ligase [Vicinamibacteria bacterium]